MGTEIALEVVQCVGDTIVEKEIEKRRKPFASKAAVEIVGIKVGVEFKRQDLRPDDEHLINSNLEELEPPKAGKDPCYPKNTKQMTKNSYSLLVKRDPLNPG